MATLLETLADTGIIRRRHAALTGMHPLGRLRASPSQSLSSTAAWTRGGEFCAAAGRHGLPARSISGTVEHYYRDGVLVGERRHHESWLGLAVLRRLDKQAEQDRAD